MFTKRISEKRIPVIFQCVFVHLANGPEFFLNSFPLFMKWHGPKCADKRLCQSIAKQAKATAHSIPKKDIA